jgi:hypothetical protein
MDDRISNPFQRQQQPGRQKKETQEDDEFNKRRRLNTPSSRLDGLRLKETESRGFVFEEDAKTTPPKQCYLDAKCNVQTVSSVWMEKHRDGLIPDNVYCGRLPLCFKDTLGMVMTILSL